MAYEMVMPYHLHMPSYFLETFTEYPCFIGDINKTLRFFGIRRSVFPFSIMLWDSLTGE